MSNERRIVTLSSRVNAVETLYSAFPAFMYIDPTLGRPLLEHLFHLQASPNYTIPFAAADLGAFQQFESLEASTTEDIHKGSSYPNVTISNSYHNQGVERLYLPFGTHPSLMDSSSLYRVWEYVDHDLRPRSCEWRW